MILQRRRLQTRPRLRAVVPAAGLGTRPRPLTAELPKALLPVLGRPLIAWTLERLAGAGVEAIAINLHHRGE
jgi:MurNAc alpha-1-phosphate uridylyltransferase